MSLEFMAMTWLKFEKRCDALLRERTPRYGHGLPDVLGINASRYVFEIEIKRSLSDFKANSLKPHIAAREAHPVHAKYWPKYFWYLVPHELCCRVKPLVPPWAGLLRGPDASERQQIISVKPAKANAAAEKLSLLECARLMHCMANQIYSGEERHAGRIERLGYDLEKDYEI